jgi:hypothetical protein
VETTHKIEGKYRQTNALDPDQGVFVTMLETPSIIAQV